MLIKFAVLDEQNVVKNIIVVEDSNMPPRPVNKTTSQHLREYATSIAGSPCIEFYERQKNST